MKAYDLYKKFQSLPSGKQDYAIGWLSAAFDIINEGCTYKHPDQEHAAWAVVQFEQAIAASQKFEK